VAVRVELEDQRAEDLARGGDGAERGDAAALVAIQARARAEQDEPGEDPEGQAAGAAGAALEQEAGADERRKAEGQVRGAQHCPPSAGARAPRTSSERMSRPRRAAARCRLRRF
jgi:hypothetical protein